MYVTLRGLRIISPSFTECGGRGGPRMSRPTLEHFITEATISEVQNCAHQNNYCNSSWEANAEILLTTA